MNNPSEPSKSDGKNQKDRAWVYASEGTQLAITLLIGVALGYWIDTKKGTQPWFTLLGSILGIALALYNFLRRFLVK